MFRISRNGFTKRRFDLHIDMTQACLLLFNSACNLLTAPYSVRIGCKCVAMMKWNSIQRYRTMIVTIFRSRLRPEHAAEYALVADRIHALAATMPGFVGIRAYVADDGERVSIVEFADQQTHNAWRDHPEHQQAQQLGRERFYSTYNIQVCELARQHTFTFSGTS